MNTVFEKAKQFIYENARPLDFARWQYHFENGDKENVLRALSAYQNPDGGFGHALEPDAWNPNSSPIQTWTATEILHEIAFDDPEHPLIKGILAYLESGENFNGYLWYNTIKSNNEYPHAPWWHTESDSTCHTDYNPTACLAGFIIRFADRNSDLFRLGCVIAQEAVAQLFAGERQNDMHTTLCYIRLAEYCEEAEAFDIFDIQKLKSQLLIAVKNQVNVDEWETSYACKPSQFLSSQNSDFCCAIEDVAEYECDFIEKTQLADGSWSIPWCWGDYPEEWALSKNWWKSNNIILNMLYLRGFGKL